MEISELFYRRDYQTLKYYVFRIEKLLYPSRPTIVVYTEVRYTTVRRLGQKDQHPGNSTENVGPSHQRVKFPYCPEQFVRLLLLTTKTRQTITLRSQTLLLVYPHFWPYFTDSTPPKVHGRQGNKEYRNRRHLLLTVNRSQGHTPSLHCHYCTVVTSENPPVKSLGR